MIATALVFALGALVASFVALIFAPILWSNAQRLARREFQATIPASVREMRAEVDAVRARAAFDMRQEAMRHRAAHETSVRERAEAGRAILENGRLLARQAELERAIAEGESRTAALEDHLRSVTGERDALLKTRADLASRLDRREGELAHLDAKYRGLSEAFDEQRFRLATAEARIAELSTIARQPSMSGLEPASPAADPSAVLTGSSRLRAAIAHTSANKTQAPGPDHAEIRERIGDIAARVIHERIKAEGADSAIARMIADAPAPAEAGEPLLADRVRRLQAEEAPVTVPPARESGEARSRRKSRR